MEDVEKAWDKAVKQPTLRMLVGLPLSGKTSFRQNSSLVGICISTDDLIEQMASQYNMLYDEAFPAFIGAATTASIELAKYAISKGSDIVWDQTNLTLKSRKAKLALFDDKSAWKYKKIAYYFTPPDHKILMQRQVHRVGKTIPGKVLRSMREKFYIPGLDEGFDQIIHVSGITGEITYDSENLNFGAPDKFKPIEPPTMVPLSIETKTEKLKKSLISHYQYLYNESSSAGRKLEIQTEFIRQLYLFQDKPYVTDALIEEANGYLGIK